MLQLQSRAFLLSSKARPTPMGSQDGPQTQKDTYVPGNTATKSQPTLVPSTKDKRTLTVCTGLCWQYEREIARKSVREELSKQRARAKLPRATCHSAKGLAAGRHMTDIFWMNCTCFQEELSLAEKEKYVVPS